MYTSLKCGSCVWNLLKAPADTLSRGLCPHRALDCVPALLCLSFRFPVHHMVPVRPNGPSRFYTIIFYMTDFVSICSFMSGEDMRELGEVSSVVHRTVLPTAASVQLSAVQHPTGQEQGD